jgi:hypothetical protein
VRHGNGGDFSALEQDFRRITIVSVTGLQAVAEGAMRAIVKSAAEMPGAKAMLISPERPDSAPAWVQHVPVRPFGYMEYSLFILYVLHRFIETDFALIVQDDGWVLSGANWRSEFLDWDIVGAPVHLARVVTESSDTFHTGFQWEPFVGQANTRVDVVYNGGFTLRSKRLLEAPRRMRLPLLIPPVSKIVGPPWQMQWDADVVFEDVHLCTVMRPELERAGIRFAPLDLAREFAIEQVGGDFHKGLDFGRLFGQHSKYRRLTSVDPHVVRYTVDRERVARIHGEDRVLRLLESRGIKVEWPSD